MRAAYTYAVLRYVHDTTTEEFLNVGVAMYSPKALFAGALCRSTYGRIKRTFPDLEGKAFRSAIQEVQKAFSKEGKRLAEELPLTQYKSVLEIAHSILPHDDSSLQWSPVGAGLAEDPQKELQNLFSRYVNCYEAASHESGRSDDDVWRTYKKNLETRNVLNYLKEKRIAVADDEVEFSHAWKNGIWHCLEPVSFDLIQAESIRDKAHKWLGHITSVKEANERFKVYFLLGEPQQDQLKGAVEKAVKILEKLPVEKKVIREKDAASFSENFAEEVLQHSAD